MLMWLCSTATDPSHHESICFITLDCLLHKRTFSIFDIRGSACFSDLHMIVQLSLIAFANPRLDGFLLAYRHQAQGFQDVFRKAP